MRLRYDSVNACWAGYCGCFDLFGGVALWVAGWLVDVVVCDLVTGWLGRDWFGCNWFGICLVYLFGVDC